MLNKTNLIKLPQYYLTKTCIHQFQVIALLANLSQYNTNTQLILIYRALPLSALARTEVPLILNENKCVCLHVRNVYPSVPSFHSYLNKCTCARARSCNLDLSSRERNTLEILRYKDFFYKSHEPIFKHQRKLDFFFQSKHLTRVFFFLRRPKFNNLIFLLMKKTHTATRYTFPSSNKKSYYILFKKGSPSRACRMKISHFPT